MTTFCNCETCQKIKKQILNPECPYCGEHHDSRIACPAQISGPKNPYDKLNKSRNLLRFVGDKKEKIDPDIEEAKPNPKNYAYHIEICDGKYTVYIEKGTNEFKALRYGKPWQDLCGNNLVYWLMVELIEAKEKLEALQFMLDQNICLETTFLSIKAVEDILKGEML